MCTSSVLLPGKTAQEGCSKTSVRNNITRFVISQKSAYLVYCAAEA